MSLRSSAEHENGGVPLDRIRLLPPTGEGRDGGAKQSRNHPFLYPSPSRGRNGGHCGGHELADTNLFSKEITKDTKDSDNFDSELRALRVLRGENLAFYFGCGSAGLGPSW
jgi:hypothetical protein